MGQAIGILLIAGVILLIAKGAAILTGILGLIAAGVVGLIVWVLLTPFKMDDGPRLVVSAFVGVIVSGFWIYSQLGGWGLAGVVVCVIFVIIKTSN